MTLTGTFALRFLQITVVLQFNNGVVDSPGTSVAHGFKCTIEYNDGKQSGPLQP